MKQVLIIITALCLALSLAACSENGQTSTYREDNYTDLRPQIDVTASDTSSNAAPVLADGTRCEYNTFYEFVAEKDADYSFVIIKDSDSALENLKWYIYVLDERFENGMRYLYESDNPDYTVTAEMPAIASVKAGQYIYCFCSQNAYNVSSGAEIDAHLEITEGRVELPTSSDVLSTEGDVASED